MSFTGIFVATLLIAFFMVMATLSTSMIYAVTQLLSWCAEMLFDLHTPRHSRI